MNKFIEWLEDMSAKDTRVRAVLRRSLAFEPGTFVPSYPYIEPFLRDEESSFRRKAHYLVAGLWALHRGKNRPDTRLTIGKACAMHQLKSGSTSMERRFIGLLDADFDELPHRLRQMIGLLKEQAIDFNSLLQGLLNWNDEVKRTQNAWARDFYRNIDARVMAENAKHKEEE